MHTRLDTNLKRAANVDIFYISNKRAPEKSRARLEFLSRFLNLSLGSQLPDLHLQFYHLL